MDGPRSRGYGARSGYDVRTRRLCGGPEGRDGVNGDVHTRLIGRDALAKGHSVVVLVRSKARALDLPGSRRDRGVARSAHPLLGHRRDRQRELGASRIAPSVPAFAPAAHPRPAARGRALPLLPAVTWGSASDRITASVAGDLPRIIRAIWTAPREAERTRRACGIRTP